MKRLNATTIRLKHIDLRWFLTEAKYRTNGAEVEITLFAQDIQVHPKRKPPPADGGLGNPQGGAIGETPYCLGGVGTTSAS